MCISQLLILISQLSVIKYVRYLYRDTLFDRWMVLAGMQIDMFDPDNKY